MTEVLRRLRRSPRMLTGALILTVFVIVAVIGPVLFRDPNAFVGPPRMAPSVRFPLGTTSSGQSILAQLVVATRGSVEVGFLSAAIATALSIVVGIGGGFVGGWADDLLALLTNVVLVIPALPLIIIVAAFVKTGGLDTTVAVIAFTSWAAAARVLRAQTLSVRSRDYVLAARVSGERAWRIAAVEILPNELAIIVSQFIFTVIFAVLTQATLAFLGLENPGTLTWGNMLYLANNDEALTSGMWWWFVPPGLCIALLGTSLALINFGLDEMLNPRLRRAKGGRKAHA
jgi:peptide/nickel transport system permease protein